MDAEIGDLKLSDIKMIHAQMTGQKVKEDKGKDAGKDSDSKNNESKDATKDDLDEIETKQNDAKKKATDDTDEAAGNELTFKKIHLRISSDKKNKDDPRLNALQLDGQVTFNGNASANAKLRIASDGLTIEGGIDDFKIPETEITIKKAGLSIFIAFKHEKKDKSKGKAEEKATDDGQKKQETAVGEENAASTGVVSTVLSSEKSQTDLDDTDQGHNKKEELDEDESSKDKAKDGEKDNDKDKTAVKRESKFEILGVIEIQKFEVSIGFHMERKKGKKERDWLVFGAVRGGMRLAEVWPELRGSFLDLQLENVALIASSQKKKAQERLRKGRRQGCRERLQEGF